MDCEREVGDEFRARDEEEDGNYAGRGVSARFLYIESLLTRIFNQERTL